MATRLIGRPVSAIMMPSGRDWALDSATSEQLAASANDGTAYAGRYEIDTRTRTVKHRILIGDRLELSGTYSSCGDTPDFTLTLLRERAPT